MEPKESQLADFLARADELMARAAPTLSAPVEQLVARVVAGDAQLAYDIAVGIAERHNSRDVLRGLSRAARTPAQAELMDTFAARLPVHLVGLFAGPVLQVNLRCFEQPQPVLAYVDDVGSRIELVSGLTSQGRAQFTASPFMWLGPERDALRLVVDRAAPGEPTLLVKSVGEFCCELSHQRSDGTWVPLYRADFTLK